MGNKGTIRMLWLNLRQTKNHENPINNIDAIAAVVAKGLDEIEIL